jgi:hypothetical protein
VVNIPFDRLIECCTYDVNLRENKGIKIKKRVASLYICRSADNGFYQGCKKKGSVPNILKKGSVPNIS